MAPTDPTKINKVVVHPLVLLSVVDHFNRMGKVGNVKRTVGVLLGANRQGILDVSNSYAGLVNLIFNKDVVKLVNRAHSFYLLFCGCRQNCGTRSFVRQSSLLCSAC